MADGASGGPRGGVPAQLRGRLATERGPAPSDSVGGIPSRPYRRDHILDSLAPPLQLYVLQQFTRSALRHLAAEEHLGVRFGRRSNLDIAADIVAARNALENVAAAYPQRLGERRAELPLQQERGHGRALVSPALEAHDAARMQAELAALRERLEDCEERLRANGVAVAVEGAPTAGSL